MKKQSKKSTPKKTATPAAKLTNAAIPGKVAVNKVRKPTYGYVNEMTTTLVGEHVVKTLDAVGGIWEIYKTTSTSVTRKPGKTKPEKEVVRFTFGNRLKSRNGNVLCSNFGFNRLANAIHNIKAVNKSGKLK